MRHLVVGTAGHIDHGKSALVEALTGVHPDRLAEEKRRGITIDLGFADLALPPDGVVSLVDVPGHERFVRHMVAGASGIDAVILVIAADEGVKPQTEEHLEICSLLGLTRGVVVLSKADLVDPDVREVASLEVREALAGSFLAASPILHVSARTGAGVEALREALRELLRTVPERPPLGVPRLPIDRSFVLKGFGTVVTGTLASGTLREGDEIEILPGGARGRIRGLQVHRRKVAAAEAGRRVAVNLQGLDREDAPRGATVTHPGALRTTRRARVAVELLEGAPPLGRGGTVRFHHHTSEGAARMRVSGPSATGALEAEVVLAGATVLLPGDRFVLRRPAPVDTLGGGVVLDAHPPEAARGASRRRLAARLPSAPAVGLADRVDRAGDAGCVPSEAAAELGRSVAEIDAESISLEAAARVVRAAGRLLGRSVWAGAEARVLEALRAFHAGEPLRPGMSREALRQIASPAMISEVFRELLLGMERDGSIRLRGESVALAGHRIVLSPDDAARAAGIDETFRSAALDPPAVEEVLRAHGGPSGRRLLDLLVAEGRLVKIRDGRLFHAEALELLRRAVREFGRRSSTMDVGAFKDLAGVTRKNAIPLLEQLDAERVTRRVGNVREILGGDAAR